MCAKIKDGQLLKFPYTWDDLSEIEAEAYKTMMESCVGCAVL